MAGPSSVALLKRKFENFEIKYQEEEEQILKRIDLTQFFSKYSFQLGRRKTQTKLAFTEISLLRRSLIQCPRVIKDFGVGTTGLTQS